MIAARKGSPIVVGIERRIFIASDATPIVEYIQNVAYLNDGEVATIDNGKLTVKLLTTKPKFLLFRN